jgi:hypothetical protein
VAPHAGCTQNLTPSFKLGADFGDTKMTNALNGEAVDQHAQRKIGNERVAITIMGRPDDAGSKNDQIRLTEVDGYS